MKKRIFALILTTLLLIGSFAGCGNSGKKGDTPDTPQVDDNEQEQEPDTNIENNDNPDNDNNDGTKVPEVNHDNEVRSVLTNEWIPKSNENRRPLALMVPNDKAALPHYNISDAGVIYQCSVEEPFTRLMVLYDDYESLGDRIGNVRSARTYFIYWAMEWDPLFIHFGGPKLYVSDILKSGLISSVDLTNSPKGTEKSAGNETETGLKAHYYRATDRKAPQNAYVSAASIENAINSKKYSKTYTDLYKGAHFTFADENNPVDLSKTGYAIECNTLDFKNIYTHDKTYFLYDSNEKKYLRYQFGEAHVDEATGEQLAFENIIVQFCNWRKLDAKGYLEFYFKEGMNGYYITNGYAIPITWEKEDDFALTKYYDASGNEIVLNTGKTMICIVEDTAEDSLTIN